MDLACDLLRGFTQDSAGRSASNLRVADTSVMPTIPSGNTYLGCVMVAEWIASKMKVGERGKKDRG